MRLPNKPVVKIFVRHAESCKDAGAERSAGCKCPKWLRYSLHGRQRRVKANTRSWSAAETQAKLLQDRLDAGESAVAAPPASQTISEAIETFLSGKQSEGVAPGTITKLRWQLGQLERFLSARSIFFPSAITPKDLIDYRASWKVGTVTKQKTQQNIRGFIRGACKENASELLSVLKTIRLSKADRERLEPKPFTEAELKRLFAQVPRTMSDSAKAARMIVFIRCMVSTGLAIIDTVQLERASIKGGWLKIARQKTSRSVRQRLDPGLHRDLEAVANGNPKYVFWNGTSTPESATGWWQRHLKRLMIAANVYIPGNLSHRFRDTAVDFWLGAGCSMTEVAAMLGDTVAVCERHYANLASARMEERLSKMPVRSWDAAEAR